MLLKSTVLSWFCISVCPFSGVFRGEGACACPPPPFKPTIIFYDGIFGCFTNFFLLKTSKFRHSVTKKRQLLGDFPRPRTGALPLDPTGGHPSPRPPGPPPFTHSKYATAYLYVPSGSPHPVCITSSQSPSSLSPSIIPRVGSVFYSVSQILFSIVFLVPFRSICSVLPSRAFVMTVSCCGALEIIGVIRPFYRAMLRILADLLLFGPPCRSMRWSIFMIACVV